MKPYYDHAGVTIYHGDARYLLGGMEPIDVLLTDPPYAPNGDTPESNSRAGIAVALNKASTLLRTDGTALVFSTSSARGLDFIRESMKPLPLKRLLPWVKDTSISAVGGPWRWDSVLIGVYGRGTWGRPKARGWFNNAEVSPAKAGHPLSLPEGMGYWLTGVFEPGKRILDPFCGSGSLLLDAARAGHRSIGIEIEERYCEIAAKRCAQEVMALDAEGK